MFVNMDYVAIDGPLRGLFDEEMLANAVRAERESGGTRATEHEVDLDDDEDRPDTVEDQLALAARRRLRAGRSALQMGRGRDLRVRAAL